MNYEQLKQIINQQVGQVEWLLTNSSLEGILLNGEDFKEYIIDEKDGTTWILKDNMEYRFHIEKGMRIGPAEAYILKLFSKKEINNE